VCEGPTPSCIHLPQLRRDEYVKAARGQGRRRWALPHDCRKRSPAWGCHPHQASPVSCHFHGASVQGLAQLSLGGARLAGGRCGRSRQPLQRPLHCGRCRFCLARWRPRGPHGDAGGWGWGRARGRCRPGHPHPIGGPAAARLVQCCLPSLFLALDMASLSAVGRGSRGPGLLLPRGCAGISCGCCR
jgi:hypothetical protein